MASQVNMFRDALAACRRALLSVGIFSFAVNLLMLTTSVYMMQIYDRVLIGGSRSTLLYLTIIAIGAVLVLAFLDVARNRILIRTGSWLERRLAPAAFGRSIDAALDQQTMGQEPLKDLSVLRNFLSSPAVLAFFDAPWVPAYLGVIYLLHPYLGHVALAGAVVLFSLALLSKKLTYASQKQSNAAASQAGRTAGLALRNAAAIDSMGLQDAVTQRWAVLNENNLDHQQQASQRGAMVLGASKFVRLAVQITVLAIGALLVIDQQLSGGAMIAASIIMGRALAPVEQGIGAWRQAIQAWEARQRLIAFFARAPRRAAGMALPDPTGHLSIEGLAFSFEPGRAATLYGLSFEVRPGEALAVIGPSAAGKSTLARLLVGIAKPSSGTVRLDGADVFKWPRADLGRHVGYLPQDVELFAGTAAENIARLGRVDGAAVVEAAKLAHCHEMILRLEDGYQTELGDGGTRLSAGQRQRIALARALYRRPKLVVLDEPNANLDAEGEIALNNAITAIKASGATVVVVGHRPGTLASVDRILVLVDGRINLLGPRDQVLAALRERTVRPAAPAVGSDGGRP